MGMKSVYLQYVYIHIHVLYLHVRKTAYLCERMMSREEGCYLKVLKARGIRGKRRQKGGNRGGTEI